MRAALAHQREQVELGLRAGADADHDDAAAGRQRARGSRAGWARRRARGRRRTGRARRSPRGRSRVRAERGDLLAQLRVADGRGDARAGARAELDRGGADAAGAAVHEQPLAGAQARLREERVVGGREDLREAARLPASRARRGPASASRSWTTASSAWPPPPTIAITRSPSAKRRRARPEAATSPASSRPGDVLRRAGRRRVEPAPLHHVGAVEAGGAHAHEHLAGAGSRVRVVLDEDLAVADRGGAHGGGV